MSIVRIQVTKEMIDKCLSFSNKIIGENNQFNRMTPSYSNYNPDLQKRIRIMRTFVGKLGELSFSVYLDSLNINNDISEMFEIFEGQTNVDNLDFETKDGRSIDIKTAVFNNHTRLVIPLDQLQNIPKDFYVGIKLGINQSSNRYEYLDPYSIKHVDIWGYEEYSNIIMKPTGHLGEFPCKFIRLNQLKPISKLISLM